jgi:hypothetical protein
MSTQPLDFAMGEYLHEPVVGAPTANTGIIDSVNVMNLPPYQDLGGFASSVGGSYANHHTALNLNTGAIPLGTGYLGGGGNAITNTVSAGPTGQWAEVAPPETGANPFIPDNVNGWNIPDIGFASFDVNPDYNFNNTADVGNVASGFASMQSDLDGQFSREAILASLMADLDNQEDRRATGASLPTLTEIGRSAMCLESERLPMRHWERFDTTLINGELRFEFQSFL